MGIWFDWLKESIRIADPLFYESGEMANPQRMMRALEVVQVPGFRSFHFETGKTQSIPHS